MAKKQSGAPEAKEGTSNNLVQQVQRLFSYVEDSKAELRKVTWPTMKETKSTTLVVLGFAVVMAIFLGLVDLGFSKIIQFILS